MPTAPTRRVVGRRCWLRDPYKDETIVITDAKEWEVGWARCETAHTFSIALLVGPTLDTFLAFLALAVGAFLCYAVLDTAEAGTSVVTLLARLLAVGAGVLDLPALGARRLSVHHAWWERVHVHWHARVGERVHGHGGLWRVGGRLRGMVLVVGTGVRHGGGRLRRSICVRDDEETGIKEGTENEAGI